MMFGSPTPKYFGANDPIDGVPLSWSAHPDGYPIRAGDAPNLVERERLAHAGVKFFARTKRFCLPEDIEAYTAVVDWIANSGSQLRFEERIPAKDGDGKMWVYIQWFDVRGYIPKTPPRSPAADSAVGRLPR